MRDFVEEMLRGGDLVKATDTKPVYICVQILNLDNYKMLHMGHTYIPKKKINTTQNMKNQKYF